VGTIGGLLLLVLVVLFIVVFILIFVQVVAVLSPCNRLRF